ncbi:neuroligin-4, X-linked-like isoform X1 [Euwallacea fornicatus]|uniref:neuroligin-4, X-linked-like isoform X1 n=1 Tax=Euwallacea fornicatus TaxID=995702 RepID=UPI00338F0EA3
MCYITKSMTIVITLCYATARGSDYSERTREVYLNKQGYIHGSVVHLRNQSLPPVAVYRGIPYATPPVGEFRFMPPKSTVSAWNGVKNMDQFGPVCPQKFPDESIMTTARKEYVNRLKKYLRYQSEDCLYLNIYAPYQVFGPKSRIFPVIVFLHDAESFEWSSGNPYDGSVLASFGQVVVVTLNFRLGILGFLKADPEESSTLSQSNFGLVDQVAALVWIKANIGAFNGNPESITLLGHGTGAVFASLLTMSPMAVDGQNELLFHRAILMSGTALSDWGLVKKPLDVSIQVAQALNCQLTDNFAACLRKKSLNELMDATPETDPFKTTFGPVVDNIFVPNDPKKLMTQYTDIFKRFELMYGVTELESIHLPLGGDMAVIHGMLENKRDEELGKYMRVRCEIKPDVCLAETRAKYNYNERSFQRDQTWMDGQPDRATLARDELLDILSDARTVAPVLQTGLYHSSLNIQSYFYVFSHKTRAKDYIRNKTHTGEELPYVFGVPIEGARFHFEDVPYSDNEKRLSMTIMRYFCNFANTGNPEIPKADYFRLSDYPSWHQFDKEWYQFDQMEQRYIEFDIPIRIGQFYREPQMSYWNNAFSNLSENPLPWNTYTSTTDQPSAVIHIIDTTRSKLFNKKFYVPGRIVTAPPAEEVKQNTSSANVLIIVGAIFLLVNFAFFTFLYFKCIKNKKVPLSGTVRLPPSGGSVEEDKGGILSSCSLIQMLRSRAEEDVYDAVQIDKGTAKVKLTRAMSNSTIDAHAKVREWITNEIVLKYSPKQDRKEAKKSKKKPGNALELLEDGPTRPVSPQQVAKPLLIKTASIDRSNRRKRTDNKVSVAIDATPTGRGPSVMMQQPIELTKSLDYSHSKQSPLPLRRSVTLEDFSSVKANQELRKSTNSIDLKVVETEPIYIRIEHGHSKSDPVQDLDYNAIKRLKSFEPQLDVNVTSRDENLEVLPPLSPEEALMTIKRRNFPKVLPDHPGKLNNRRSMPVNFGPYSPMGKKFPPVPPPRTCTLDRQGSNPQAVCLSEPMLAEEPPSSPEPEVACNNLYVGPLIPKEKRGIPRAIVTTDPKNPVKRPDPKFVVKPTINNRSKGDETRHIPRVVVPDNRPEVAKSGKKSQIPTLVKSTGSLNKEASSSESASPSSGDSDTGTVVKRV